MGVCTSLRRVCAQRSITSWSAVAESTIFVVRLCRLFSWAGSDSIVSIAAAARGGLHVSAKHPAHVLLDAGSQLTKSSSQVEQAEWLISLYPYPYTSEAGGYPGWGLGIMCSDVVDKGLA